MGKRQEVNSDTLSTTLAIIKPDGMKFGKRILQILMANGFHIVQRKKFILSPELAAEFYKDFEKCKIYMLLVLNLSNGPIEAVILAKANAIRELLELAGPNKPSEARYCKPNSLRSLFGDCEDDFKNAIHTSLDIDSSRREINFFFPNYVVEPVSIEMAQQIFCIRREISEKLVEGLFDITKARPEELKTWLANWFIENNPNRPIIYPASITDAAPCKMEKISPKIPEKIEDICEQLSKRHDPCGLAPCPDCKVANDKVDLEKLLCCCNVGVQPTEIVNCPVCDKIIVYSVPCGEGATKKLKSSSHSTTTSLTSSSSILSSCKCSDQNILHRKSTSSSISCKCADKGGPSLSSSSSTNTDRGDCSCPPL